MRIRPVEAADLPGVFAIYNREIREGVAKLADICRRELQVEIDASSLAGIR